MNRLKVIVLAYACDPYKGSEAFFGWSAVTALASHFDLTVITWEKSRESILKEINAKPDLSDVEFIFLGENSTYHPNRLIARFQGWLRFYRWVRSAEKKAVELFRDKNADLIHIVTFSTWRVAYNIPSEIPYIWGPIGGGEVFPRKFLGELSRNSRIFELVRMASNLFSSIHPRTKKCIRDAGIVIPGNSETQSRLRKIHNEVNIASPLSAAFYTNQKIHDYSKSLGCKNYEGAIRIFSGGNLEGRKGVRLSLQSLSLVKKQGINFQYIIGGSGPERASLEELSEKLGLCDMVTFTDGYRGSQYEEMLHECHIYLLPSLREYAGLTMMDAMLAGCVPVVLKSGGPAEIVQSDCGYSIRVSDSQQVVVDIAGALMELDQDRSRMKLLGLESSSRIKNAYSEDNYISRISKAYHMITEHHRLA